MIASPISRLHSHDRSPNNVQAGNPSGVISRGHTLKDVARFSPRRRIVSESLLIRALRKAFPSARSHKQLAELAAPLLGLSIRQVENILIGQHDGKSLHLEMLLLRLLPVIGIEKLAQLIEGKTIR